jgi:hypothetical protein
MTHGRKPAGGRYSGPSIARRPASVILYRRTSITLPPARTVSAATVAQPTRKNSATIFAAISLAISAASVTPSGPVFARSSRMRRRSSLRGIALSYGSVHAGANRVWIVSGGSNDSATNRNARVLGRTAPDIEQPLGHPACFSEKRLSARPLRRSSRVLAAASCRASRRAWQARRAAAGGRQGGRVGRGRGRALAVEYHKPESCKRAPAPANEHPSQS